jgi:hypothetical protein
MDYPEFYGVIAKKYSARLKDKYQLLVYFEPVEKVLDNHKNVKVIASKDIAVFEMFIRDRLNKKDAKNYGVDLDSLIAKLDRERMVKYEQKVEPNQIYSVQKVEEILT